jgi:hypothetical protein
MKFNEVIKEYKNRIAFGDGIFILTLKTSAFRYKVCLMLGVVQHFDKHCTCYLQDEYVLVGHFGSLMYSREWMGHGM